MKKRMISLTLALGVLIGMLVLPANAAGFTDVKKGDYFYDAVQWAVAQGITNGTSATTFSPNQTCTKAQILTFLWRAAGCPDYSGYTSSPFTDVKLTDYCFEPAIWAISEAITDDATVHFKPNTPCTRASTIEYMWKAAGWQNQAPVSFSDVKSGTNLAQAVSWAIRNGVTNGTSNTTFSPNDTVTRGQIVTFLYRQYVAPIDNSALTDPKPVQPAQPTGLAPDNELDPLCPEDYRKGPDWYGECTPIDKLSNYRIVIEHKRAEERLDYFRANNIAFTEPPMIREMDLYNAIRYRWDHRNDPEYAKYGSIEPIRTYLGR